MKRFLAGCVLAVSLSTRAHALLPLGNAVDPVFTQGLTNTPTLATLSSASINFGVSSSTPVAGISGQTVRVMELVIVSSNTTTVTLQSAGTALTGPMTLIAGTPLVLQLTGEPWFVTAAGQGFVITQTGNGQISGRVYYTQS